MRLPVTWPLLLIIRSPSQSSGLKIARFFVRIGQPACRVSHISPCTVGDSGRFGGTGFCDVGARRATAFFRLFGTLEPVSLVALRGYRFAALILRRNQVREKASKPISPRYRWPSRRRCFTRGALSRFSQPVSWRLCWRRYFLCYFRVPDYANSCARTSGRDVQHCSFL